MKYRFFLGTYTSKLGHVDGCGPGVALCELDSETGEMALVGAAEKVENPSYLWLNAGRDRLYSICEVCDFEGREDGALCCFAVGEGGSLTLLQQRSSNGPGPAYCRGDESGRALLVANYVGGSVNVYPVCEDGSLGDPVSGARHFGSGPNEERQEAPHPHSIMSMPGNEIVFVGDLGIDRLVAYRLEADDLSIRSLDAFTVRLPAGSGPRHFVVCERRRTIYVALELSSEIAVVRFDEEWRQRGEVETVRSHGRKDACGSHPSEIALSSDGRHVYIANRGVDCLSGFSVLEDGGLRWIGDFGCVGKTPRHMALTPDGGALVVAHQDSSTVDTYFRDLEEGTLKASGRSLAVGTPAFVAFL